MSELARAAQELGHEIVAVAPDVYIQRGWRYEHQAIAALNKCPTIVAEWGYFDRVSSKENGYSGHWQLSIGGLNQLPQGEFPPDRFNATGCKLIERKPVKGYALLCGQVAVDAAVQGIDHKAWLQHQYNDISVNGYEVRYRKHPRGGVDLDGVESSTASLAEDLAGAAFLVCYNSNVGHDALLAGVPVICDQTAPYHELSGFTLPSRAKRLAYFSRAAYGQWRASEAVEGLAATLARLS